MFAHTLLPPRERQIPEEAFPASLETAARVGTQETNRSVSFVRWLGNLLVLMGGLQVSSSPCPHVTQNGFSSTCSGDLHPYTEPLQWSLPQLGFAPARVPISHLWFPPIFWEVGDFLFPSFNCPLWKARLKRPAVGVCMPRFRFLQNDRKGFCLWISSDNSLPPLVSMRNTGLQSVSWWLFFTETLLHYIFLMQNLQWLSTRMVQLKASSFSILLF